MWLIDQIADPHERDRTSRRLRLLQIRLAEGRGRGLGNTVQQEYREKLLRVLAEPSDTVKRE